MFYHVSKIASKIDTAFGIRCPQSILSGPDVGYVNDFEGCAYTDQFIQDVAFCGKCATPSSSNFLTNINILLDFNYVSLFFFY